MKLKKISNERASEITKQSEGAIQFKIIDNVIKGITFPSAVGNIYVDIDSYSISIAEEATKEVFKLSFFAQVADEKIFIEKEFESEYDRQQYIQKHLYDMPDDEMSLSVATVKDC